MDEVNVIYCDLPPTVKGMIVKTFDEEECYTIVINSRLNAEQQQAAYEHEMKHYKARDFNSEVPVEDIEYMRHL